MASSSHKTDHSLGEKAKRAGWLRFVQVLAYVPNRQKLYRSSSPSYSKLGPGTDHDMSQELTSKAINFLVEQKIDSIISFNKYEYKPDEQAELANKGITYLHLPVADWCAPTLQQLKDANEFFTKKSSTLVHCGYGHGRTGTGVTALQICATNGQTLDPLASKWWGGRGNHVEKRRQMSVLAELRNTLLQNRTKGIMDDPGVTKEFAIINLATGYYLTTQTNTVIALSPEAVELSISSCKRREHCWIITKVKDSETFQLSNCATAGRLADTKSNGAGVNDPVTIESGSGANTQFTMTEATEIGDGGFYVICPLPNADLAIAIKEPDDSYKRLNQSSRMPALLAAKDERNRFGLWVVLPIYSRNPSRP